MAEIGSGAQVQRMREVKGAIVETLAKNFKHNTEAAVLAGACMQVIVGLLNGYPPEVRKALAEGMIMVLQGERDDESPLIVRPH